MIGLVGDIPQEVTIVNKSLAQQVKLIQGLDSNAKPKEVAIEDKTVLKQVKLIAQLNKKDKSTVVNIIDMMLTKQMFQNFFEQNLQPNK